MQPLAIYPELEQAYKLFRTQAHNPLCVLYPCCATDATPSNAFDNVTYVDLDKESINTLQQAGYNAHLKDIRDYQPKQQHDLLILLNPSIPSAWATPYLQRDGYIIANNWHNTATSLNHLPKQFKLWGTLNYHKSPSINTDLTNLFHPVKDEQELQHYRPDHYDFLKNVIANFANQSFILASKNDSFTQQLQAFCKTMNQEMPSRRVADLYIFKKK